MSDVKKEPETIFCKIDAPEDIIPTPYFNESFKEASMMLFEQLPEGLTPTEVTSRMQLLFNVLCNQERENRSNFINAMSSWLDKNGLVKPQPDWNDSGNGLLYTSIFHIFMQYYFGHNNLKNLRELVRKCYYKKGCLMRTPNNAFGQEQFDDYLGIFVACAWIQETLLPREILWYGITHFFIYDNNDKFEAKDFLGRFPHIFYIGFLAAFPGTRKYLKPISWLIKQFVKIKPEHANDDSGVQLQLLLMLGLDAFSDLGAVEGWVKNGEKVLGKDFYKIAFARYYHKDHPFAAIIKRGLW